MAPRSSLVFSSPFPDEKRPRSRHESGQRDVSDRSSLMRTNHRWLATLTVALASAVGLAALPASAAPDTSLKDTMKKMQAQVLNGDAKPLGALFDATKGKGKPEFANWNAISD